MDNGDESDTWVRRRMGVPPGGDSYGSRGPPPHKVVYYEAAGDHS